MQKERLLQGFIQLLIHLLNVKFWQEMWEASEMWGNRCFGIDPSNTNHQPPVTTLKPIAYSWIPQMGETSPRLGLETNFEDIVPWRLMALMAVEELDHSVDIRISMDMRIHHP